MIGIPESDVTLSFVRASGPGGQNVNKVASAVQLRFDLAGTAILSERVKRRLRALAGRRLTDDGQILIIARNHRTQEQNRREAYARLTGTPPRQQGAHAAKQTIAPPREPGRIAQSRVRHLQNAVTDLLV